jgi:hypothetical protein
LHIVLGNSASEKELLKQELVELRSQLETERADRERIGAELSPAKGKFCSGRRTFPEVNTRRGHNSQPARPPSAKNQKLTWQIWNSFWRFYKAEATKIYSHLLTRI